MTGTGAVTRNMSRGPSLPPAARPGAGASTPVTVARTKTRFRSRRTAAPFRYDNQAGCHTRPGRRPSAGSTGEGSAGHWRCPPPCAPDRVRGSLVRSAGEELAEAGEALDELVLGKGVGEAAIAGGAEGFPGHEGDGHLLEEDLGQLQGALGAPAAYLPSQFEGREGVEGALRFPARHSRNGGQQLVGLSPAAVEGLAHGGGEV